MGILDDAIRDHLALKRQSGAAQSDLKRLEDEAFGPPSRPGDPPSDSSPALTAEPGAQETALEEPTVLDQQAAAPGAPPGGDVPSDDIAVEPGAAVDPSAEGPVDISDMPAFHDFAAEEGLVSASAAPAPAAPAEAPPVPPAEPAQSPPAEPSQAPPVEQPEQREPEQPVEPPPDDTQPHDMATELQTQEEQVAPPAEEIDIDADLDLDLGEEEELRPENVRPDAPPPRPEPAADRGTAEVVEEDEDELEEEELLDDDDVEVVEDDDVDPEDEGEDVLEETPDFLRETPEHDRLWFEQRPPKDFDFEE